MIPLILGLFGALFAFGNSEVHRFESLAARDIRSTIRGEHAKVSVRTELNGIIGGPLGDLTKVTIRASDFETDGVPLFVQPGLSQKGIVRNLRIELREFVLAGLRIQALTSTIPDCRFDYSLAIGKHKIRLSRSGVGRGEVLIRQRDLEAYILRKFGEIKKVSVQIGQGRVRVDGFGEFVIVKANFSVDAKLVSPNGTTLMLDDAKISFDGKPASDLERETLLKTLNPVVDLNKDLHLHDAIYVDEIDLENGILKAQGSTKIPIQPDGSLSPRSLESREPSLRTRVGLAALRGAPRLWRSCPACRTAPCPGPGRLRPSPGHS